MNTKHTPGPWRLSHVTPSYGSTQQYVIWATMPYQYLQSQPGNDNVIGSINLQESYGHVWQFPTDKHGEMIRESSFNRSELPAEMNAKIICASPLMYEILVAFVNQTNPDVKKFQQDALNLLNSL